MLRLHCDFPDGHEEILPLTKKLIVGSDDELDLSVQDYGLAPQHLIFRTKNGQVSVINLGSSDSVKINKFKLQHGKMYLLTEEDVVVVGDIEFFIENSDQPAAMENEENDQEEEVSDMDNTGVTIDRLIERETIAQQKEGKEKKGKGIMGNLKLENTRPKEMNLGVRSQSKTSESQEKPLISRKPVPTLKPTGRNGNKKKFQVQDTGDVPSVLTRLLAALLSFSLVFFYLPLIFDSSFQKSLSNKLFELLNQIAPDIVNAITFIPKEVSGDFISYLLIWAVFDLAMSLLFGVSLGLLLMGFVQEGGFLSSRIKGFLKTGLSFILFPFLPLLNLPSVAGKRTVLDTLTLIRYHKFSRLLPFLSIFIVYPGLITFSQVSKMVFSKEDPIVVINQKFEVPPKFEEKDQYLSSSMNVLFQYIDADDNKIRLYPHLIEKDPILKRATTKEIQAKLALKIVSLKSPAWALMVKDEMNFDVSFLDFILEKNPILSTFSPSFGKKEISLAERQKKAKQLLDLIQWSLNPVLEKDKLVDLISWHGPYLTYLNEFALKVRRDLGIKTKAMVKRYQHTKHQFLTVEQDINKSQTVHIHYDFTTTPITRWIFIANKNNVDFLKDVERTLLYSLQFIEDSDQYNQLRILNPNINTWHDFKEFDFVSQLLNRSDKSQFQWIEPRLRDLFDRYYQDIGSAIGKTEGDLSLAYTTSYLNELNSILTEQPITNNKNLEVFKRNLSRMMEAITKKDSDFFRSLTYETKSSGEIRIIDATEDIIENTDE